MAHDPGAGLDQALAQARQGPGLDHLRRRQRSQEVGEIVGQRMKLKPDRVGGELHARQACPLDGVLAFFDVLLSRSPAVVEGQHPFVGKAAVGDDESHAREQLSRMELDLGHYPARLRPALRART